MFNEGNSFKKFLIGTTIVTGLGATNVANADRYAGWHPHRESVEIDDHHVFNTDEIVDGATVLIRDRARREITATISTNALEPHTAYSIWWAVFNFPRYCLEPYRCGVADLGSNADPRVRPSVFWAGGFVSDMTGTANTSIRLRRGRTSRELFAGTRNYGLQNFWGSEVHVVMRTHGPVGLAGNVSEQIGTANGACPADGCRNVFASIHSRRR